MSTVEPTNGSAKPGQELASSLRAAVRAEDYEEVPDLVLRYSERLQSRLHEGTPSVDEAEKWLLEAAELLQWAKSTVAANRAHTLAKLTQIDRAEKYRSQAAGGSRSWAVEG